MGRKKGEPVKKIGISLPEELIAWVDDLVDKAVFASRSHAIRVALLWLKKYIDEHGHPPML